MNLDYKNITVVIPCYKVAAQIESVVRGLPEIVTNVILVDDKSPDNTLDILLDISKNNDRVTVLKHSENKGVGGAMVSGFTVAKEIGSDIVIKIDGDGQMDLKYIPELCEHIVSGKYDFAKGNRFSNFRALSGMPIIRRIGNLGLSFMIKAASGYWSIFDPTNGYFTISKYVLDKINLDKLSNRYFFESSLIIELYYAGARIRDVSMPAIYGEEKSNLSIIKTLFGFPPKLLKAFVRRLILRYFVCDFNIYSIYILLGIPLFLFGTIYGSIKWYHYSSLATQTPTGTIMIATLSIVFSFQMLLSTLEYDITSKNPFEKEN